MSSSTIVDRVVHGTAQLLRLVIPGFVCCVIVRKLVCLTIEQCALASAIVGPLLYSSTRAIARVENPGGKFRRFLRWFFVGNADDLREDIIRDFEFANDSEERSNLQKYFGAQERSSDFWERSGRRTNRESDHYWCLSCSANGALVGVMVLAGAFSLEALKFWAATEESRGSFPTGQWLRVAGGLVAFLILRLLADAYMKQIHEMDRLALKPPPRWPK